MKQLYPNHLVARPEHIELNQSEVRLGDQVHVQPVDGPKIVGEAIFSSDIFGCNTYTADATIGCISKPQRVRVRFRQQDIHHVATNPIH